MTANRSTIVNTSGERKYFDFLPLAGGYMEIGEEREFFGNVSDWIREGEGMQAAFDYATENGHIRIKSTPPTLILDGVTGNTREVVVNSGTLSSVSPLYLPTTTTTTTTSTTS